MQKRVYLKYVVFCSSILGRLEGSRGWAHMQSVHACAAQTHFSVFVFLLKKSFLKSVHWVRFGVIIRVKCYICVKKNASKHVSKKGASPKANKGLSAGREGPGEAASRAHFSDKKQLFEQRLKHCSRFLQKKLNWARNWCEQTDWTAESWQKTEWTLTVEN